MLKNWIVYILALIGSVVFFLFYQMWLAWYCFVLLLLIFPLALFMCLLSGFSIKVHLEAPRYIKIGDEAYIRVKAKGSGLSKLALCRINLKITEYMTDTIRKAKIFAQGDMNNQYPIDTAHCGAYTYTVDAIRVYDVFGLFCIKKKGRAKCEVVVRPIPSMPDVMPEMNGFKAKVLAKSNSPYSEIYDVRDYVIGDPIKNIHWKASAKKDKLLIKEPQEEKYGHARVYLALKEDRDELDKKMGELLFTSNYFLSREIQHMIRILPPYKREVAFDIQSQRDLDTAIIKILHMKIPKEDSDD